MHVWYIVKVYNEQDMDFFFFLNSVQCYLIDPIRHAIWPYVNNYICVVMPKRLCLSENVIHALDLTPSKTGHFTLIYLLIPLMIFTLYNIYLFIFFLE